MSKYTKLPTLSSDSWNYTMYIYCVLVCLFHTWSVMKIWQQKHIPASDRCRVNILHCSLCILNVWLWGIRAWRVFFSSPLQTNITWSSSFTHGLLVFSVHMRQHPQKKCTLILFSEYFWSFDFTICFLYYFVTKNIKRKSNTVRYIFL